MAINRTSISITLASGETSGDNTIAQVTGELLNIVFDLPDNAPAAAQYHIYQLSPQITLLQVTGQQIADQDDGLFTPRKLADTPEGYAVGEGGAPFPTTIPLAARLRMDITGAVAGTYTAYIYYSS